MFTQIFCLLILINASHSDTMLPGRMAAGEADAFSQLFNRYWDKVYSTALVFTSITACVWNNKMYLYPLPTQELQLNPNLLPQNTGW